MDKIDRRVINEFQAGLPLIARPFEPLAKELGVSEETVLEHIETLLEKRTLSRFGPLYHAERLGGGLTLAAMEIPAEQYESVAQVLMDMPEVAHNYEREHQLNMWFVLATEKPEQIASTIEEIEKSTGFQVHNMPKLKEFYIGLRLAV